jgi:hypothetical protein
MSRTLDCGGSFTPFANEGVELPVFSVVICGGDEGRPGDHGGCGHHSMQSAKTANVALT